MNKLLKDIICKLYYKYCFSTDTLGQHIVCYHIPILMKKISCNCKVDGSFLFAQLEEQLNGNAKLTPLIDLHFNK